MYEGRKVNIYKRAQILVAGKLPPFFVHIIPLPSSSLPRFSVLTHTDIWACFTPDPWGNFSDINTLTMFADYRVPVILHALGCLLYSPPLEAHIRALKPLPSGHPWELQLRGTSIWCVEMIRREIMSLHPENDKLSSEINAVLLDFYLYDSAKEMEEKGIEEIPCHRTRSIWY